MLSPVCWTEFGTIQYTGCMNLQTIGHLIAERRRAKGLTLTQVATQAAVGRSTLAALETGKLPELGLERVARLCAVVDLVLEARPLELKEPLMTHRHLCEVAGRELTKAAIDDIITRGTIGTWRKLVQAMHADKTGRIARRVTDVAQTQGKRDPKARAFAALLRKLKAHDAAAG
jgi:transcriptional regulator with XRE-family HTH domain